MRGALLIVKKEFMELFKDRKTVFFTFAVPLLLYPMMFLMIGKLAQSDSAQRKSKASRVCVSDPSQLVIPILKADSKKFEIVDKPQGELKRALLDQQLELAVDVDPKASEKIEKQETFVIKATADQSDASGRLALERFREALRTQDEKWVKARLEALHTSTQLAVPTKLEKLDAGDENLSLAKALGSFLPYMLMLMMFFGAMQPGIYVTAGETERGTLQSLLATSLPRTQIIIGKLLYVFSIGVISAVLNIISMTFSMAKLASMGMSTQAGTATAQHTAPNLAAIAHPTTIALALLLMIPLGLLFSNIILIGGIHAKNSQEAGTSLMPAILVVLFLGIFSMAPGLEKMAALPYIPIVNVSLAIRKLLSQQGSAWEYCVAFLMTVGLAGLLTYLSTRLLNRESVLFKV